MAWVVWRPRPRALLTSPTGRRKTGSRALRMLDLPYAGVAGEGVQLPARLPAQLADPRRWRH